MILFGKVVMPNMFSVESPDFHYEIAKTLLDKEQKQINIIDSYIMLKIKKTYVYNLSYGKSYSIDNISSILNLKIESDETIKPTFSNLSNAKIKKEFSINFKYDLESGLKIQFNE